MSAKVSSAALAQMLGLSVRTIQRWNRRDGYGRPSHEDRLLLIQAVHNRHHEGRSVRQIVAWLAEYGHPRSIGWVHGAVTRYQCDGCSQTTVVASERPSGLDSAVQTRHMTQVNGGGSDAA